MNRKLGKKILTDWLNYKFADSSEKCHNHEGYNHKNNN